MGPNFSFGQTPTYFQGKTPGVFGVLPLARSAVDYITVAS